MFRVLFIVISYFDAVKELHWTCLAAWNLMRYVKFWNIKKAKSICPLSALRTWPDIGLLRCHVILHYQSTRNWVQIEISSYSVVFW